MYIAQPALGSRGRGESVEGPPPALVSPSDKKLDLLTAPSLPNSDAETGEAGSKGASVQQAPPLSISRLRQMGTEAPEKQQTPSAAGKPMAPIKYKVVDGDTISGIAEKFGVSVDSIIWSNSLADPNGLQIGDELLIPPVTGVLHKVASGDNLNDLALLYDVTPEAIAEFNALADPNSLQVGQLLVVPGGKLQMARATATSRGGGAATVRTTASGSFRWPAGGSITQYFGENGHTGLDLAGGAGSPIYAADGGVVVTALKLNYGYGWYLVIDHENGYRTLYGHLSAFYVDYGERVAKGTTIGAMGSTGLSTGPHLHFEMFRNGVQVNPLKYLP